MHIIESNGYQSALSTAVRLVRAKGNATSQGRGKTWEVEDAVIHLTDPRQRVMVATGEEPVVVACVAQALQRLSLRDSSVLEHFDLPIGTPTARDPQLGDPLAPYRLRNWNGVDQLQHLVHLLQNKPSSRRGIATFVDPVHEPIEGPSDLACNNWLQCSIRDERLNMRVASRGMNLIWTSAVNVFEWTVLQELLAFWLGVQVGTYTHFIGSLHFYEVDQERADHLASCEDSDDYPVPLAWDVPFAGLEDQLAAVTREVRRTLESPNQYAMDSDGITSAALQTCARVLRAGILHQQHDDMAARGEVEHLPDSDLKAAVLHYLASARPASSADEQARP